MQSAPYRSVPRWLHGWAILTVTATAVLLALGSLVTTFRVGMADPVWPTTPWFLFFASWTEPKPGFIIEHAHRLAQTLERTLRKPGVLPARAIGLLA